MENFSALYVASASLVLFVWALCSGAQGISLLPLAVLLATAAAVLSRRPRWLWLGAVICLLAPSGAWAKRDREAERRDACAQARAEVAECSRRDVDPGASVLQMVEEVRHEVSCLEKTAKTLQKRCRGTMAWKAPAEKSVGQGSTLGPLQQETAPPTAE